MNFRKSRGRSRRNSMNFMINSEKWRHYGRQMSRADEYVEEDSDDDEPKSNELKDWVEEFFGRKSITETKSDQDIEVKLTRKQTIILSTLVPDEILLMDRFDSTEPKQFVGVLLMADVSGYTALSERYNNTGKGGTYRLTVTLNTYLGSLIELIYTHGGDVLKFAGDAFLALWKTDKRTFISHTIHTAITCALVIQHSYASYETDVKVNLRVKLAIAAGNLIFTPIGTGTDMNYIIFGLPVVEAKFAESVCSSGEVKLTPTAWAHCYSRNYDHIIHENGHVTIRSILYDPREKDVSKPFQGLGSLLRQVKKTFNAVENLPDRYWDSTKNLNATDVLKKNEALSLRKTILMSEERDIGSEIRKFMIRPVLTQIDAHQPLEYLTEMRQVSVLFLTFKPSECQYMQLITIVNNAYQITCEIVYKSLGCVNKIILFDKDVMILVIFGLRGFKHESEAQAALKCAYSIKKSVSALDGIREVSIGVTTGPVYCGVVGHPLRREFTVIGAVVNKAARLMCYFSNKITCDELTFVKSKMSKNGFTLQPKTELKGIMHPGKIYEYTEEIRIKELHDIAMIPPLLDRSDEMEYFENWLDDNHMSFRDFDALLLIGESRIGKSRLLEWMARFARNKNFEVCYINLTSIHSATPYLALSQIINQILGLVEPIPGFTKEEKIVQLLKVYNEDLCYLNHILKVRFAYHESVYVQDEQKRMEKAKQMFSKLINSILDTHVIFFDDLQNLDPNSWDFISILLDKIKIFTVFTVTRGKFSSVHSWLYSVFIHSNIRKIVLGPLGSNWIPPLACQILDVDAVPNDLCNALRSKCKGMPGLIESFIVHLFSSGALDLKKILDEELDQWKNEELQFPDSQLLHPQAVNAKDQTKLEQLLKEEATREIGICIVTQKEELNTNINVQNLDALIMIQIDSLTPYQQLLVKIASVIGNIISRDLLESIMYENNELTTAKAIKRLFAMRILSCANAKNKWRPKMSSTISAPRTHRNHEHTNLDCECSFDYDSSENLPKYAFCKVMRFRSKNSRKTCYELLPLNQKKEFHSRIVNYLENSKQKCTNCGGTIMVVQSTFSLNIGKENKSDIDHMNIRPTGENSYIGRTEGCKIENTANQLEIITKNSDELRISKSPNISSEKSHNNNENTGTTNETLACTDSTISVISTRSCSHMPLLKMKYDDGEMFNGRRSTKRVTIPNILFKNQSLDSVDTIKVFDMLRAVTEADTISDWHNIGVNDEEDTNDEKKKKTSFSVKIEKNISKTNFSRCTCSELNITIYEQLINHAKQANLKLKMIEFLIKYSYLNLLIGNVDNAFMKLEDAEECLDTSLKGNISSFNKRRFLGRIFSLKATGCLMRNSLSAAKIYIEKAIRTYGINLDKVTEFFKLRNIGAKIKQKYRQHETIMKSDSIFCLNVATLVYSALGDDKISRVSALRALNLIQKVECNVVDLCETLNNAIQVELNSGNADYTAYIEHVAKEALKNLSQPIQADELHALGKLFNATLRARIARAELSAAIRAGFRAIVISRFVHADNVSLDIIPDLFYILLARRRIDEAIDIVQEAQRLGYNRVSYECEMWYYALCTDMVLDAGFQLESPYDITRFAEFVIKKDILTGSYSRRRLIVGLWTYWLRVDNERKAKLFEAESLHWAAQEDDDGSLTTLISALRLAEGMLESLARKVDDLRKVVDLMALRSLADRELSRLEKDTRVCRAVYPRWILLKAYSLNLSGRQSAATSTMNQALEEARKIRNCIEEAAALATGTNSPLWLHSALTGDFMNWREGKAHVQTSWYQILYNITNKRGQ